MQVGAGGKNHFACKLGETQNLASFRKKIRAHLVQVSNFVEKKILSGGLGIITLKLLNGKR